MENGKHFNLLFSDTRPHPYLQAVGAASQRFTRVWQGLWFRYGERAEGHPAYRQAFQTYHDEIYRAAQHLLLINEIRWYAAMMSMIGKVAVIDDASAGHPDAARHASWATTPEVVFFVCPLHVAYWPKLLDGSCERY